MKNPVNLSCRSEAEGITATLGRSGLATSNEPLDLATALELGIRSAELLVLDQLVGIAGAYPATMQGLLSEPEPEIDESDEAMVEERDCLGFVDFMDLLSVDGLVCVSPRIHRGWQDKTQSCAESRRLSRGVVGLSLDEPKRRELLRALSIRNRIFRAPPPVRVDSGQLRSALVVMFDLLLRLAEKNEVPEVASTIGELRVQLQSD